MAPLDQDPQRSAHTRLSRLPATFTAKQARRAGVVPRDLYRLRDDDELLELSRGVFRKADAPETEHLDLLAIAARAPRAVVCLESTLSLHGLIDDIPSHVHIAVPRGTRPPQIDYPPVVVSRFDSKTFEVGVEMLEAAPGEHVRIYSAARSVVDAMRLRHRVGEDLALHALRVALYSGVARPAELLKFARLLGVAGPVYTAVDAVLS